MAEPLTQSSQKRNSYMSTTLFLGIYPQQPTRLRDHGALTKFITAAVTQGFLLTTHEAYPALLQQINQNPHSITPAMNEKLSIMVAEYCEGQREEFTCTLLHV